MADDDSIADLGAGQIHPDGPLEAKDVWEGRAVEALEGVAITGPGFELPQAHGPRAPSPGRHNWVPAGPRNVGGRVRAIAIDPAHPEIMYAGAASGGVYKSIDGAESWFPLWHDEPSLSIGAISICRGHPDVVWVATGEPKKIFGRGVFRSEDQGRTWSTAPDVPPPGFLNLRNLRFDAVAAHPTNPLVCWAVGESGIYRTTNGGQGWKQFSKDFPFTDVAFSVAKKANVHDPDQPVLILVPGKGIPDGASPLRRAFVVRLDQPDAGDAAITLLLPNGAAGAPVAPVAGVRSLIPAVVPAPGDPVPEPGNGKVAVCSSSPNVAFVRFATDKERSYGTFRTQKAQDALNALDWGQLVDDPSFSDERQGGYNLTLAVNPRDPNHLASGMVELWVHRTANAADVVTSHAAPRNEWFQAMFWQFYHLDRGHHADHHQTVFAEPPAGNLRLATAGAVVLWDANDGGISYSDTWLDSPALPGAPAGSPRRTTSGYSPFTQLPLPSNVIVWRKRSHGIGASQMYDLTQSPLMPTMYACGFQDNGVFLCTGGPSWQLVLTADGGFVAFDPDDPYHFICTWQGGITDGSFAGQIKGVQGFIGEGVIDSLWPRELTDGFLPVDHAAFVADTAFHSMEPGRVLNARKNRLYSTDPSRGDRWNPVNLGAALDLLFTPQRANDAAGAPTEAYIEVLDTPGSRKLGLFTQRTYSSARDGMPVSARLSTLSSPPWSLAGDRIQLKLPGLAPGDPERDLAIEFGVSPELPDPARASAVQLAKHITARSGGIINALPRVLPEPRAVVLATMQTGRAQTITLGGTARALSDLGVNPRAYAGADGAPAAAYLRPDRKDFRGQNLTISLNAGAVHTINFDSDVVDPHAVSYADLAAAIRTKLGAEAPQFLVATTNLTLGVRFSATGPGAVVSLDNTALASLKLVEGSPTQGSSLLTSKGVEHLTFKSSVAATPLQLGIQDGLGGSRTITFNAALGLGDLTSVSPVELVRIVRDALAHRAGVPDIRVRCDLDVHYQHPADWKSSSEGQVSEVAFSVQHPGLVWVGDDSGRLYRSNDGGAVWESVPDPPFVERRGPVEAIAIHPDRPQTVYVGTSKEWPEYREPGFLYRTDDNGATWRHVGADLKDAAGGLVGINALEVDPENPATVFAATHIGVFRTTNGGDGWSTFNEGLPNARIIDLALVPSTRTLRCGAWGRGCYERHIGDLPARDVALALRANAIDPGGRRPAPTGPDGLALTPAAVRNDESPDIKLARSLPASGLLIDGVEFDEDINHEDAVPGTTNVGVQVHNRGSFNAHDVRVVVLWAPAAAAPPKLPDGFWADLLASGHFARDAGKGSWTVMNDENLPSHGVGHDVVAPGEPRVLTFPYTWPGSLADHRRIGILAIVTAAGDAVGPALSTDIPQLINREPKVAYRAVKVIPLDEDRGFLIRATGAVPITTSAPGAPVVAEDPAAADALGLPDAVAVNQVVAANTEPYDLRPDGTHTRAFRVTGSVAMDVGFTADDPAFENPVSHTSRITQARPNEAAEIINRLAVRNRIPIRARAASIAGVPNSALRLEGRGPAVRRAAIVTSGAAATLLGLPVGVSQASMVTDPAHSAPWDLTGQTLQLVVSFDASVEFPPATPEIADLAAARAFEVRAAINRQLKVFRIPAVAETRRIELVVRRSVTEAPGSRVSTGGAQFADLVATESPVVGDDAQKALFELVSVLSVDRVRPSSNNQLYLRSVSLGNMNLTGVHHRLFLLNPEVTPVTCSAVAAQDANLDAGSSRISEFVWDPGAVASGSRLFVLAVVDHDDRPLVVGPTFPSWVAAEEFCRVNPSAAYREFQVS
jgi:photosystem II stability/assembly factor-like uncharacterized protein